MQAVQRQTAVQANDLSVCEERSDAAISIAARNTIGIASRCRSQ